MYRINLGTKNKPIYSDVQLLMKDSKYFVWLNKDGISWCKTKVNRES